MPKAKLECKGKWVLVGSIKKIDNPPVLNHAGVSPPGKLSVGVLIKIVGNGFERKQRVNSLIPKNSLDWIGIEEWPVEIGDRVYVCAKKAKPPDPDPDPGPNSDTDPDPGPGFGPNHPMPPPPTTTPPSPPMPIPNDPFIIPRPRNGVCP